MTDHAIVPTSLCPTCGYMFDAVGLVEGGDVTPRPTIGDITGCMACGQPLVFDQSMQVRVLTPFEYDALEPGQKQDLAKIRAFADTGWLRKSRPRAT
jgi:hypothetical protein